MGREIKRVVLDFSHPIGEVWPGYLNPHYAGQVDCSVCAGSGGSPAGRLLNALWYRHLHREALQLLAQYEYPPALVRFAAAVLVSGEGWNSHIDQDDVIALVEAGRLWDFTRTPRTDEQREIVKAKLASGGNSWLPEDNGYVPIADEVNAWSRRGLGHDSINNWVCVKARCKRYEQPEYCAACNGSGHVPNPELEARIEAWKETDPPAGEGWQVWETVTEGSPISPVFPDAEACIAWLVNDQGYSPQAARAFVGHGWAPSLMGVEGVGLWDGITGMGITEARIREHA